MVRFKRIATGVILLLLLLAIAEVWWVTPTATPIQPEMMKDGAQ